jgi:TonB family protein
VKKVFLVSAILVLAGLVLADDPAPYTSDARLIPVKLRIPAVGSAGEFGRLFHEVVEVRGKPIRIALPGSWISLVVEAELTSDGKVVNVWAGEAELHRVDGDRLVSATDAFLTPSELRRFRETAERAMRESTFELDGELKQDAGTHRGRITIYWRIGAGGTVDLRTLGTSFRREGGLMLSMDTADPVVVLLGGPMRDVEAEFPREIGDRERLEAGGIPPDLLSSEGETRCGIFRELPAGLEVTREREATLIEESRIRADYPEQTRIHRAGGRVAMQVVISETGEVRGAVIEEGAPGFPSLARSAVEAVCRQRYFPPLVEGAPAASVLPVTTVFEIRVPTREMLEKMPPSSDR